MQMKPNASASFNPTTSAAARTSPAAQNRVVQKKMNGPGAQPPLRQVQQNRGPVRPQVIQRTILLETEAEKADFETARSIAAQDELDYSATQYAKRYGTDVVVLGSGQPINTHETLYVIGHRNTAIRFTRFGDDLFRVLKQHGVTPGMKVDLVGCETNNSKTAKELRDYGVEVVSHPDIHITTATGDHIISNAVANPSFAIKKRDLEEMTERAVNDICAVLNYLKSVSGTLEPEERSEWVAFFQSIRAKANTTFKLVDFAVVKKENLIASSINSNLTKIIQAIGSQKADYKNMDLFLRILRAARPEMGSQYWKEAADKIFHINEMLRINAVEYQRQYEASLVVEQRIVHDATMLLKEERAIAEELAMVYGWSGREVDAQLLARKFSEAARSRMTTRELEVPSYIN